MNKPDILNALAQKTGAEKAVVEKILDAFEELVIEKLKSGDEITLTGFGTFSAKHRHARMGVNPQNPAEKIKMPEMRVPKFKAGKTLKDVLKSKAAEQN